MTTHTINELKSAGFAHLESAICKSCIDAYIDAYTKILVQQLEKLGVSTSWHLEFSQGTVEYVDSLVMELDSACRPALNEASTMARNTLAGHQLALEAATSVIDLFTDIAHAQVSSPSLFINIPNNPKGNIRSMRSHIGTLKDIALQIYGSLFYGHAQVKTR